MNILDMITNSGNGAAVRQLGAQVGLSDDQTSAALSALLPALASGFQRNLQSQNGMADLLGALAGGNHARYLDNPDTLGQPGAVDDGNGILGHVFGSRDVSRQVAARASAQTGISADILKRLLPLVATMVMASFAKQRANGGTAAAAPGGDITGMLGSLLDSNRDGSIVDDVTSMLGRFMGR